MMNDRSMAALWLSELETCRGGMERTVVINHLGPFLLTNLLLPDLRKSAAASALAAADGKNPMRASRVVNVSSRLEKRGRFLAMEAGLPPGIEWFKPPPEKFVGMREYGTSKLGNLLFTFELDRRLSAASRDTEGRVTANAVTPGLVVTTDLSRNVVHPWVGWALKPVLSLFMRDLDKGAETVVWAATSEQVESSGGKFFGDLQETPCSDASKDVKLSQKLWEASEVASGLKDSERVV